MTCKRSSRRLKPQRVIIQWRYSSRTTDNVRTSRTRSNHWFQSVQCGFCSHRGTRWVNRSQGPHFLEHHPLIWSTANPVLQRFHQLREATSEICLHILGSLNHERLV